MKYLPDPVVQWWLDAGGEVAPDAEDVIYAITEEKLEQFLAKITKESVLAGVRLAKQRMNNALAELRDNPKVDSHDS